MDYNKMTERYKFNRKIHEQIGKFVKMFPELRYGQILSSLGMAYPNDVFNDESETLYKRMLVKEKELGWNEKMNGDETNTNLPIKQTRDVLIGYETLIPFDDGEYTEPELVCSKNGWHIKIYDDLDILSIRTMHGREYFALDEMRGRPKMVRYKLIDGNQIDLNPDFITEIKPAVLVHFWKDGDEEMNYTLFLKRNDRVVNEIEDEEVKNKAQRLVGTKLSLLYGDKQIW